MDTDVRGSAWWGSWGLPERDTARRWRIGPMTFWLMGARREWRLVYETANDPLASDLEVGTVVPASDVPASGNVERFVHGETSGNVSLSPVSADRPLVTQPEVPFYLLGSEEILLFVSSPLWLRIERAPGARPVRELPLYRPSDTWLGPSTRSGELCYASRTHCRMDLADVPLRPHRAISAVVIRNRIDEPLRIERLSVPVPYLSLYVDKKDGHLWTESITMTRSDEQDGLARLEIEKGAPVEAGPGAERVAGPRSERSESLLVRAFSGLL